MLADAFPFWDVNLRATVRAFDLKSTSGHMIARHVLCGFPYIIRKPIKIKNARFRHFTASFLPSNSIMRRKEQTSERARTKSQGNRKEASPMNHNAFAGFSEKEINMALAFLKLLREHNAEDDARRDRVTRMVAQYGECTTQAKAAHILSTDATTVYRMLHDGRLTRVCENKVDVRSIAAYMDKPAEADFKARIAKRNGGKTPKYHVT